MKNNVSRLFLAGLFLLLMLLGPTLSSGLQIQQVIVVSPQPFLSGLEIFNRQNLLLFNKDNAYQYLIKRNPIAYEINFTKKYPRTLVVEVNLRKPVAQVVGNSTVFYIDSEGILLLQQAMDLYLPRIEAANISLTPGQKADWRIIKAASILEEFSGQSIFVEQIFIDNDSNLFKVYLTDETLVVMSYSTNPSLIAASLQVIISRFRIEGKFISKIDFRFDKPVVVLANGEKFSDTDAVN